MPLGVTVVVSPLVNGSVSIGTSGATSVGGHVCTFVVDANSDQAAIDVGTALQQRLINMGMQADMLVKDKRLRMNVWRSS